jgi:hypothetical protein
LLGDVLMVYGLVNRKIWDGGLWLSCELIPTMMDMLDE